MAQVTTLILLPETSYVASVPTVVGERQTACAYYSSGKDMQTISWNLNNFSGTMSIQASLVTNPTTDADWFTTYNLVCSSLTQISFTNITGNYVWVRARITNFSQGTIENIKVSY